MAQFAYFRIEHSSFNRGDWGYGRVANAAHYAANQNKRGHVVSVGLPVYQTSYDAQRGFMALEKQATRKNARLGDTLIVSLPHQVSPEHRLTMMERFMDRLTFGGRTYAQAWEHTDKPDNPHFHVVLIDRDRETGKSVGKFGHSRSYRAKQGLEPNVTEWMRKQWEETGNEVFAEFGYSLTFDRRSNLERGLEPPEQHRGYANDNGAEELSPTPVAEDAFQGDEDMSVIERDDLSFSPIARIKFVHEQHLDLNHLHHCQDKLQHARERFEYLVEQREKASQEAGDYYRDSLETLQDAYNAEARLKELQTESGQLKGRSFSLFGKTLFRTSTRKQAEEAQQQAQYARMEARGVEHRRRAMDQKVTELSAQATKAEEQAFVYQAELERLYGTDEEIVKAEAMMESAIRDTADSVTLDDARTAYNAGAITDEEYRAFLLNAGYQEELAALDEELSEGGYSL